RAGSPRSRREAERSPAKRAPEPDPVAGQAMRPPTEPKPSHVCRLFHQHQPTFGAFLRCFPSRPVPLEIHRAGVRESKAAAFVGFFFGRREAMVMKQVFRDSTAGDCSTQRMPSANAIGRASCG